MGKDKRGQQPAIPEQLTGLLNEMQFMTLRQMENFGWTLAFIRRPPFENPIAVIKSPDATEMAILEADGQLNMSPEIIIREWPPVLDRPIAI